MAMPAATVQEMRPLKRYVPETDGVAVFSPSTAESPTVAEEGGRSHHERG